jgi:hypothetical protein
MTYLGRTCRGWHWLPTLYKGVNGCTTHLLVWGVWAWEVEDGWNPRSW